MLHILLLHVCPWRSPRAGGVITSCYLHLCDGVLAWMPLGRPWGLGFVVVAGLASPGPDLGYDLMGDQRVIFGGAVGCGAGLRLAGCAFPHHAMLRCVMMCHALLFCVGVVVPLLYCAML